MAFEKKTEESGKEINELVNAVKTLAKIEAAEIKLIEKIEKAVLESEDRNEVFEAIMAAFLIVGDKVKDIEVEWNVLDLIRSRLDCYVQFASMKDNKKVWDLNIKRLGKVDEDMRFHIEKNSLYKNKAYQSYDGKYFMRFGLEKISIEKKSIERIKIEANTLIEQWDAYGEQNGIDDGITDNFSKLALLTKELIRRAEKIDDKSFLLLGQLVGKLND